jgi:hypothetical protein
VMGPERTVDITARERENLLTIGSYPCPPAHL